MTTDPAPHLFWITSRAAGTVALVTASLAVCVGLLMSIRWLKGRGPDLRVVHEILSLSTLVAIAVHGLVLVGDSFLHPSLADVTIPFVSGYKTIWTTLGIISGWALVVLGLSYYARGRIGPARWRRLHRWIAVAWILGVVHGLMEGTDAGTTWFVLTVAAAVLPPFAMLAARHAAAPPGRATA